MRRLVLLACALVLAATPASAATVTINPSRDNTIADGVDPGSGEDFKDNSSGACADVFSGTTADTFARRVLLSFDIAGNVPAGSTITGVTLTLTVNRSGDNVDASMTVHPVSRNWGEGTASCGPRGGGQGDPAGAGDATWLDAEFGSVTWTNPGGDFGAASATAVVGSGNGSLGVWSSATMAGEVQAWLDSPATNFGASPAARARFRPPWRSSSTRPPAPSPAASPTARAASSSRPWPAPTRVAPRRTRPPIPASPTPARSRSVPAATWTRAARTTWIGWFARTPGVPSRAPTARVVRVASTVA
jgi:hypothetical protein